MGILTIVALGLTAVILVVVLYGMFGPKQFTDRTVILKGPVAGDSCTTSNLSLGRSFNEPEGIVFSFTGWLLFKDFTKNFGKKRLIFGKGDCPSVYLDTTSNSLLINIDTFGSQESVLIPNLSANKWVHLAIVVNQYSVDVYINGTLRQHHTLSQLPKQNNDTVKMGSNTEGWDGVLSDLVYYTRSLSASEIDEMSKHVPADDMHRVPAGPQYFDMSWYTGRINSA